MKRLVTVSHSIPFTEAEGCTCGNCEGYTIHLSESQADLLCQLLFDIKYGLLELDDTTMKLSDLLLHHVCLQLDTEGVN